MFDLRESALAVNAAADARLALLNGGYLRIYDGVRPRSADETVIAQRVLVELRWNEMAFSPAIDGEAIANAIEPAEAGESGDASWFRALAASGGAVFDGSVGREGVSEDFNLTLPTTAIAKGVIVAPERFIYRQAKTLAARAG